MLKILQASLQPYVNWEHPDVQARFSKGRGTRDQIPNTHWIIERAKEFQKNIYFCFIDFTKVFVCITTHCGKFLNRWEYKTTLPASWETCIQVKKNQLELDMEQQVSSKLGKEYDKTVYCHPACLTYMQSTSMWKARLDESQAGNKIARKNINNFRYADDTTLMIENEEELMCFLMRVKEESKKVGLKLNIQKTRIIASGPITSWQVEGGKSDSIFLGSKITVDSKCSHEIQR